MAKDKRRVLYLFDVTDSSRAAVSAVLDPLKGWDEWRETVPGQIAVVGDDDGADHFDNVLPGSDVGWSLVHSQTVERGQALSKSEDPFVVALAAAPIELAASISSGKDAEQNTKT